MELQPAELSLSPPPADPFEVGVDDDFIFYLRQGAEALRGGRAQEARGALERAFALRPDSSRAQNLLGLAYFKLGLLEAAKAIYDRLVREFPSEASLLVNLGLVLLRQGRLSESESAFREALARNPGHVRAHCYLGLVLYRRGAFEEAKEHFVKGEARDFALKVEGKLLGSQPGRKPAEALLEAVATEGVARISTAPPEATFRSVEPARDESPVRNEEAWEGTTGGLPETAEDYQTPSLLSVIGATPARAPIPDADTERSVRPAVFDSDPPRDAEISVPVVDPRVVTLDDLEFMLGFSADAERPREVRLLLEGAAFVEERKLVAVYGAGALSEAGEALEPDPARARFARLEGYGRVLLAVDGHAVALREARDLVVRLGALAGFEGRFAFKRMQVVGLEVLRLSGDGSVLLDAPGRPVVVTVSAQEDFTVSPDAVLGWSLALTVDREEGPLGNGFLRFRGDGFVLLGA